MSARERTRFLETWELESKNTTRLLVALPEHQYDFRPDAGGRSLGELAWHLAEIEAYMTHGVAAGAFEFSVKLPGFVRPRSVPELASGYARVHAEALARVNGLDAEAFDRTVLFYGGRPKRIADVLWAPMLHHQIHHRGQLMLLCRLAGGTPPGIYGPTREEWAASRKD